MGPCKCGCGQEVRKAFARGHNTKRGVGGELKTRLLKNVRVDPVTRCWIWL